MVLFSAPEPANVIFLSFSSFLFPINIVHATNSIELKLTIPCVQLSGTDFEFQIMHLQNKNCFLNLFCVKFIPGYIN